MGRRNSRVKISGKPEKQNLNEEKEEFMDRIKVDINPENLKLIENREKRVRAQIADQKRKDEYLKVLDKVIKRQEEDNCR